jgi:iron complex transport system permease protein
MELLRPRTLLIRTTLSAVVLLLTMFLSSMVGTERVSMRAALNGIGLPSAPNPDYEILLRVRLPRICMAAIVGAALASSGVVFQAILRNPLADPYILGISSGAGLGATVAVLSGVSWTLWGRSPITIFAFFGAIAGIWIVWLIGRFTGKFYIAGLLLGGVIVNAFFSALIMFLTAMAKSHDIYAMIFWLMGNMTEEDFLVLWIAGGCVIAGVLGLFFISPHLNVLSLGEADARNIGINVRQVQAVAFTITALITAVAVSLSGLIGFVGLIIPHGVRLVFGPDHRQLVPLSSIAGAIFLILADTAARIVVAPAQLPVGVVTAIVGGPLFLILLVRYSKRVGWSL